VVVATVTPSACQVRGKHRGRRSPTQDLARAVVDLLTRLTASSQGVFERRREEVGLVWAIVMASYWSVIKMKCPVTGCEIEIAPGPTSRDFERGPFQVIECPSCGQNHEFTFIRSRDE
jgi:hypothetical protein